MLVMTMTGYRGVTEMVDGRFEAGIFKNGKYTYLGTFETPEAAARVADLASLAAFGAEVALLNFPDLCEYDIEYAELSY